MTHVVAVFEGDTDEPVVQKLLREVGFEHVTSIDAGGKDKIDASLRGYNDAAKGRPWFVLRDLDTDAPCAGKYIESLAMRPAAFMCHRLAVREVESWLLADAAEIARFLRVRANQIPARPDAERDPTQTLLNLVRRSTSKAIRRDMLPRTGSGAPVGPLYEARLIEFGRDRWSPVRATERSPSLARARAALRALALRWRAHSGE